MSDVIRSNQCYGANNIVCCVC